VPTTLSPPRHTASTFSGNMPRARFGPGYNPGLRVTMLASQSRSAIATPSGMVASG
jgi:hypothetical protein